MQPNVPSPNAGLPAETGTSIRKERLQIKVRERPSVRRHGVSPAYSSPGITSITMRPARMSIDLTTSEIAGTSTSLPAWLTT